MGTLRDNWQEKGPTGWLVGQVIIESSTALTYVEVRPVKCGQMLI